MHVLALKKGVPTLSSKDNSRPQAELPKDPLFACLGRAVQESYARLPGGRLDLSGLNTPHRLEQGERAPFQVWD